MPRFADGSAVSDQLVRELADRFLAVMHAMRATMDDVAQDHGLNTAQAMTLRLLDDPLSQREVAETIGCDPSYVTGIVDRLEELDAVRRVVDPDDRRVKRLVVTDAGRALRDRVEADMFAHAPMTAGLDQDQVAALHDLLGKVVAELGRS